MYLLCRYTRELKIYYMKNQIIMWKACPAFLMNVICFAVLKSQYINLHTHSASRVVQNNKTTLYVAKIVPKNEQGENEEKEKNSSQII